MLLVLCKSLQFIVSDAACSHQSHAFDIYKYIGHVAMDRHGRF